MALQTYAEAAAGAELVVNATSGAVTLEVLALAGAENLAGKPLVDISNPLDGSRASRPPCSSRTPTRSASRCSASSPTARVVKTLNTLTADLMVHPQALGASSTVFVSGDDAGAKATVTELLTSFGHDDVVDLGGIETARGAGDVAADLAAADGCARHRAVQPQDRPLTPLSRPIPEPSRSHHFRSGANVKVPVRSVPSA